MILLSDLHFYFHALFENIYVKHIEGRTPMMRLILRKISFLPLNSVEQKKLKFLSVICVTSSGQGLEVKDPNCE